MTLKAELIQVNISIHYTEHANNDLMDKLKHSFWELWNNLIVGSGVYITMNFHTKKKNLKPKYPLFPVVSKGTVTIVGWEHIMNYGKLNIFLNTYHYIICNNYYILTILLTLNLL